MAAGQGTIWKITIEVITDGNGPAKLISLEKGTFTCDSADPQTTTVVKKINTSSGDEHLQAGQRAGVPLKGDQYVVTLTSPDANPILDDTVISVAQLCSIAGGAVDTQLETYPFYD